MIGDKIFRMKIFFFTASITRSHSQSLVLNWLLLALSSLALIGSIESTALISPQETRSELWKVSSELSFPWMRTTGSAFFLVRTTVCVLRVWWNHSTQAQKSFIFLAGREQSLLPWSIGIPWKRFPYVEIPLSLEKLMVLFSAIGLFCENDPCNRILTLKKITKKRNDEF